MAIGKRLRYEILKRDGFKCRYCHDGEVLITVDHVIPKSLGGSDDPSNLVACCDDCNTGKTSTLPGGANVADAHDDLIRWTCAIKRAAYLAREKDEEMNLYREAFKVQWDRFRYKADGKTVPLPSGWGQAIDQLYAADLPDWAWDRIVGTAMNEAFRGDRFKHACDTAWRKVVELQKQARINASGNAAPLDWGKAVKGAVVDAADLVWQSSFMAAHGKDPEPEAVAGARAQAADLYPENIGPGDLLRAAETAAEYEIDDFEEALDHARMLDGDTNDGWGPDRYVDTWLEQWRAANGDREPPEGERLVFRQHADAAGWAGYEPVVIGHAAFKAGAALSPRLADFLDTAPDYLERREAEAQHKAAISAEATQLWLTGFEKAWNDRPVERDITAFTEHVAGWVGWSCDEYILEAAQSAGYDKRYEIEYFLPKDDIKAKQEVPF